MTISHLDVDLAGVFEYGQCYVALSRATSLDNLRVLGFQRKAVKVLEGVPLVFGPTFQINKD